MRELLKLMTSDHLVLQPLCYVLSQLNLYLITDTQPPVDTGRKLNVHKTFRRRPGRLLNVLCTFNLRPVLTGPRQYLDNFKITVGCLMANYGLVLRGECHSPNVNHRISFEIFDSMGTESLVTRLSHLLWQGAP